MKLFRILAATAGLLAFVACSEYATVDDPVEPKEVGFQPLTSLVTKGAVDGTTFPATSAMRVSAFLNPGTHSSATGAYFTGVRFTNAGRQWKAGKYWPLDGTLNFLAYSTATMEIAHDIIRDVTWTNDVPEQSVTMTIANNNNAFDDLLYGACNQQTFKAAGNPMQFHHAFTVVMFRVKVLDAAMAYDPTTNMGIEITGFSVNNASYGGTVVITNPGTGGDAPAVTANWTSLNTPLATLAARTWPNSELVPFTPDTEYTTASFGNAYVIMPEQAATSITLHYILHNGEDGNGTPLNNALNYNYVCSGDWLMGNKYVYDFNIALREITVNPTVEPWDVQNMSVINL